MITIRIFTYIPQFADDSFLHQYSYRTYTCHECIPHHFVVTPLKPPVHPRTAHIFSYLGDLWHNSLYWSNAASCRLSNAQNPVYLAGNPDWSIPIQLGSIIPSILQITRVWVTAHSHMQYSNGNPNVPHWNISYKMRIFAKQYCRSSEG